MSNRRDASVKPSFGTPQAKQDAVARRVRNGAEVARVDVQVARSSLRREAPPPRCDDHVTRVGVEPPSPAAREALVLAPRELLVAAAQTDLFTVRRVRQFARLASGVAARVGAGGRECLAAGAPGRSHLRRRAGRRPSVGARPDRCNARGPHAGQAVTGDEEHVSAPSAWGSMLTSSPRVVRWHAPDVGVCVIDDRQGRPGNDGEPREDTKDSAHWIARSLARNAA